MIGARVKWRHKNDEGTAPAVQLDGEVIAIERGGQPARWEILVLLDDGTMIATEPKNLVVTARPDVTIAVEDPLPLQLTEEARAALAAGADTVLQEYERLGAYLNAEWSDTSEGHDSAAKHAVALITQLKQELIEVGGEREKLREDVKRLEGFVAELKKRPAKGGGKNPGPAGPAEG